MSNYLIQQILKNHKITDFLAKRNIHPVGGEVNGKLKYNCPLHKGDSTPSFMVFTNAETQNFFCFGCKARYNIIHLYRDMENVTTKQAIVALSNGLQVDINSEIEHAIREIAEENNVFTHFSPPEQAIIIGRTLYEFVKQVKNDPDCIESAEKAAKLLDKTLGNGDLKGLEMLYNAIPDTCVKRVKLWHEEQEKRIRNAYTNAPTVRS